MNAENTWVQEQPAWCPYKDCRFLRRAMDNICAGELPEPRNHNSGINTHRFCMVTDTEIAHYQVNKTDLDWLRWIFDAIDGEESSWLSRRARAMGKRPQQEGG